MAIAFLAMALRAVVPAGFMIAPHDTTGAIEIVLCTAQGDTHITIDPETGDILSGAPYSPSSDDTDEPGASKTDAHCVFAVASVIAPPSYGPGLSVPIGVPNSDWRLASGVAPGRGLAAPPPWATGPPHLA